MPNQSRSTSLEQNMAMELYQFCRSEAICSKLTKTADLGWKVSARPDLPMEGRGTSLLRRHYFSAAGCLTGPNGYTVMPAVPQGTIPPSVS